MSRVKVLALLIAAVMLFPAATFAQNPEENKGPVAQEATPEKKTDTGMAGMMVTKMMGLMQKQMVATSDGGVIVLAGNKLLKYDKDLNLVKEAELKSDAVEIKMDAESMQKMIEKMKEKYKSH